MVSEVSAARSQLAAVQRQARADTQKAAAAAEGRTREYVDKFRDQVCLFLMFTLACCREIEQELVISNRFGSGLHQPRHSDHCEMAGWQSMCR